MWWTPILRPRNGNTRNEFRGSAALRAGGASRPRSGALPIGARQLPVRPDEVAGVAVWIALEVVLMLGLGFPEVPCRGHFRHDATRPQARGFDVGDRLLRRRPLRVAGIEDGGAVARAAIVPLPILGGRIVDLKEELEQVAVAHHLRIEDDLDRFGMGSVIAIGGVRHVAAAVSHAGADHPGHLPDQVLHAPEAAAGQHGSFGRDCHMITSIPALILTAWGPVVAMPDARPICTRLAARRRPGARTGMPI